MDKYKLANANSTGDSGHFKMDFNHKPEEKKQVKTNIPSFTDKPFGVAKVGSKNANNSGAQDAPVRKGGFFSRGPVVQTWKKEGTDAVEGYEAMLSY